MIDSFVKLATGSVLAASEAAVKSDVFPHQFGCGIALKRRGDIELGEQSRWFVLLGRAELDAHGHEWLGDGKCGELGGDEDRALGCICLGEDDDRPLANGSVIASIDLVDGIDLDFESP